MPGTKRRGLFKGLKFLKINFGLGWAGLGWENGLKLKIAHSHLCLTIIMLFSVNALGISSQV